MSWVAASGSCLGANHERRGEDSEDAHRAGHRSDVAAVVVADGHGSPRCARAASGAELVADVVFDALTARPPHQLDGLAETVVAKWRRTVDADLDRNPMSEAEADLSGGAGRLLYGTTVIGAAVDATTLRLIRIGDGDVLLGRRDRRGADQPLPSDSENSAVTDSLSHDDAEARATVAEYDLGSSPIDVVLLATDGMDAAFADPSWHDETMADLLDRLPTIEAADLGAAASTWCRAPAHVGGDDTSIALLVRRELLARTTQRSDDT